jgi:hypothetical protein
MGPMTGRGAGYCAGSDVPGYANPMPGRGLGLGWGRGRWFRRGRGRGGGWGRGRFGYAPAWGAPPPAQEVGFLKSQAEWLKAQLDAIGRRITELEQEE